jgi:hypothetical protein
VQGGKTVVRYNGTNDTLSNSGFTLSQPFTVAAVVSDAAQSTGDEQILGRSDGGADVGLLWQSGNWRLFAGSVVDGSTTAAPVILTAVFDGGSSVIRENGTQTGSGDVGNKSFGSLGIGSIDGINRFWDGDQGEILLYDSDLSATGELTEEEQRLSDKWGISI